MLSHHSYQFLTLPPLDQALAEYSAVVAPERRERSSWRIVAVAAAACAIVATCLLATNAGGSKPVEAGMYHFWLGANGLPESPRKQRGLLFQFCTTNFVTEAEMRYCYARMLGVGDPSGPMKYAGQPGYDSEQIVAPLFTFAAPAEEAVRSPPWRQPGGKLMVSSVNTHTESGGICERLTRDLPLGCLQGGNPAARSQRFPVTRAQIISQNV